MRRNKHWSCLHVNAIKRIKSVAYSAPYPPRYIAHALRICCLWFHNLIDEHAILLSRHFVFAYFIGIKNSTLQNRRQHPTVLRLLSFGAVDETRL